MNTAHLDRCHTVAEAHRFLQQHRRLHEYSLEILAGWVWTTGQFECKLAFGTHAHEEALHADMLLKRGAELPSNLPDYGDRFPIAIQDLFEDIGRDVAQAPTVAAKLGAMYGALKPWLVERYRVFELEADTVLEAPTLRVLAAIARDQHQQIAWGERALADHVREHPDARQDAAQWRARIAARLGRLEAERHGGAAPLGPLVPLLTARPAADPKMRIVYYTPGVGPSAEVDFDPRDETEIQQVMLTTMICQETEAVELLARVLAEFPALPWQMRLELSRQMWDECRHAEAQLRILRALGADVGLFPAIAVINEIVGEEPDVLKRLLVLQRVVEGTVIDQHRPRARFFLRANMHPLVHMLDYVMADEDMHIALSRWVNKLVAGDTARQHALGAYQMLKEQQMATYVDWLITKRRDLARAYSGTHAGSSPMTGAKA